MDNAEVINNMIDKIIAGDNVSAKEDFDSLISTKVTSALDARKVELAQAIYARQEDQPEEETSVEDEQDSQTDNTAV